jgi:hypothetical protein
MAKRAPLVCQHLENISRTALEKHQKIVRDYVRHREGVYALYKRNRLYYVGLASDLRARMKHHLKDRHGSSWDRFSVYLTIGDKHLKELESLLLRVIVPRPEGNGQSGKFLSSENLIRKFARDIKKEQDVERHLMIGRPLKDPKTSRKRGGNELDSYVAQKGRVILKGKYKGKTYTAIARKNGTISMNGAVYGSTSAAGQALMKGACNGWYFWRFERAPGDWVKLQKLRQ